MLLRQVTASPGDAPPAALDVDITVRRLGVEDGSDDADDVEALIYRMTSAAERIAGGNLWYREYSYRKQGDGTNLHDLPVRPIATVSLVQLDSDTALDEGTDADEYEIWNERGTLYRQSLWGTATKGWTVQWLGGYWLPSMGDDDDGGLVSASVLKEDAAALEQAIWQMVRANWEYEQTDGTLKKAKLASMSVEFFPSVLVPREALKIIQSYGEVVIA